MTSEIKPLPVLWRWVTENGVPQEGSREELAEQLASGALPSFALVWRAGWGEWLPAMQVAELVSALPFAPLSERRSARPASDPSAVPPVPISEYPRLRLLAKQASRLSRPPAVMGLRQGGAAFALQPGVAVEFDCPERDVVTSQVPAEALLEAARVMTAPTPPLDLGLEAALDAPASGRRAPSSFPPRILPPEGVPAESFAAAPASRAALPLVAEFGLEELMDPTPKQSWALWIRAHGLWVAVGSMVFWLIVSFAARWLSAPDAALGPQFAPETALQPLEAARPRPATVREVPVLGCRLRRAPQKLDDWAVPDVRPGLSSASAPAPTAPAAAVATAPATAPAIAATLWLGYAQSHEQAVGGTLDLTTLRFTRDFAEQEQHQIFSVTPFGSAGAFHVEHMGASLAFGRALDSVPPLRLGMKDAALVVGPLERRSEKVWDLPAGAMISVPEVAAHPLGFTVATRVGRNTGTILVGALSPSGAALSRLESVGSAGADYGRPALASGPEQTLLAVARRADAERGAALWVARAPNGQLPLELQPLELFNAAAAEPLAPALGALPDGGFVLMWSQGEGWRRQVRVQRLSSELVPMGAVLDLTSADPALGGATPGALYWVQDQLIALYFVRREEGHSLWASSLGCGS